MGVGSAMFGSLSGILLAGVNPGDVKSSNTDPGASADPCLDEPNRPAKAQAATSHTSNAAKTLGCVNAKVWAGAG